MTSKNVKMAGIKSTPEYVITQDEFINRFNHSLRSIDKGLPNLIEFNFQIQKNNLMSLVADATERIQSYDQIYPYIKEICKGQSINPSWYSYIEKVLLWTLKKGKGKSKILSDDIKNAWIIYIVLLSCSMIDKDDKNIKSGKQSFLKINKGNRINFRGNN